jgi:hypothetical protein
MRLRIRDLGEAISTLDKNMRGLIQQPTNTNADASLLRIYLAPEISRLSEQRIMIEQKQWDLRIAMSEFQSRPTTLITPPSLPTEPVKPQPWLYFSLAISIGLTLGILSALVMELIGKKR